MNNQSYKEHEIPLENFRQFAKQVVSMKESAMNTDITAVKVSLLGMRRRKKHLIAA
jgi:hypothetical protein